MNDVAPVPPPATVSVPDKDGVKVWVFVEETMVVPMVSPLKEPVDVANV